MFSFCWCQYCSPSCDDSFAKQYFFGKWHMTLFTLRINILLGVVEHEQKHFNGLMVGGDGGKKKENPKKY